MLVVQSYCPRDQEQALRFAAWIYELGGCKGHRLLLVEDVRCGANSIAEEYRKSFDSVEVLPFVDRFNQWPHSANAVFKLAAWHIAKNPEPWLFVEPDCVALAPNWLDRLWQEYVEGGGKPFLGDFVDVENIAVHMSGNAIYPGNLAKYAGEMLLSHETAFDMMGAAKTVPNMTRSKLLMHAWKHPRFRNWEQIEREIFAFKPECVLFHADKTGSIYPLLREHMGLQESSLFRMTTGTLEEAGKTCDILIKSYPPDYERLNYCLRSIGKFGSGFRNVVLVHPANEPPDLSLPVFRDMPIVLKPVVENGDGYLFQQVVKASAHEWTDADYILHIDSDTIVTTKISPETFIEDGKIPWLITPYKDLQRGLDELKRGNPALSHWQCATVWQRCTEQFLGPPVEFEFMRRFPMMIPRQLHLAISKFCETTHGMRLTDYILNQPNSYFSEFNALGGLAYHKFHDDFLWVDTTKIDLPPLVAIQHWSKDPLTDEKKAEFENILGGGDALCHSHQVQELPIQKQENGSNGTDEVQSSEVPESREILLRDTVSLLKQFCTAPRYVNQVRKELKQQKVT